MTTRISLLYDPQELRGELDYNYPAVEYQ